VAADLDAAQARGEIRTWWRIAEPTRVVGRRGHLRRVAVGSGLPDYLVLTREVTWAVEVKHSAQHRWPLGKLTDAQARHLTAWMAPPHRRAAVLLAYTLPHAGRVAALLDWAALGPMWSTWAAGEAARGGGSLTPSDALDIGQVWRPGGHWPRETP